MKYFAVMIVLCILMLVGCKDQLADSKGGKLNQSVPSSENHLIIYFPFNHEALDFTGHVTHIYTSSSQFINNRFGIPSSAYYFDGTRYISCGDYADINSGCITVNAWIKCDSYDTSSKIVSKGQSIFTSPANSGYSLRIVTNETYSTESKENELWFQVIDDNGTRENVSIPVSKLELNNYLMITGIYDNTVFPALLKLYVNSYLVAKKEVKLSNCNTNGSLCFGALDRGSSGSSPQYDEFFKGVIDDIRIYDCPLTDADLISLHERKD